MDVVAYDTNEPVVVFAGADIDPATATAMVGEQADLRCFDTLDAAIDEFEAADRIDCVVTTDDLAAGTGIELLEALRDRAADHRGEFGGRHATRPPAIYVPASGSVPDAEAATAAGATIYLPRERAADGELRDCLADVVEAYDRRRQHRRERELFDALLDHAPMALYAKDTEGRYVAASSYIASGFDGSPLGWTSPEIQNDDAGAIESHQDDLELIETGEPILDEVVRSISVDDEVRWHHTTKHPWRTPGGEIQGLVGVARDSTAAVEREQELERQRWRFEQFATFTSTELREPVTTSLDALDRAQAAMDRLGSTTEDDTADPEPGSTEADTAGFQFTTDEVGADADDQPLPPAAADALATVDAALEELEALIETLLTMARPQSAVPDPAWIGLENAIEQAWDAIEGTTVTLETQIDEPLEVHADAEMLRQCFEQLFRNATEQTPPENGPAAATDDPAGEGSTGDRPGTAAVGAVERITVGLTAGGFYVENDGPSTDPPDDPDADVFEYQDAGYRIAIARDFADAHDWSFELEAGRDGGMRIVVEDCLLRPGGLADATTGGSVALSASGDVGGSIPPGEAFQDGDGWVVRSGGRNLWQDVCEFHGVWATVDGDVRVQAHVTEFDAVHEHSKAGVGLYDPDDAAAPLAAATLSGSGPTEVIGRPRESEQITSHLADDETSSRRYLRVDRVGDRAILWTSPDGADWTIVDHRRFWGDEHVAAGLLVCSHSGEQHSRATFEDVQVAPLEVPE